MARDTAPRRGALGAAAPCTQAAAPCTQAAAPCTQAAAPCTQAAASCTQAAASCTQAAAPCTQAATPRGQVCSTPALWSSLASLAGASSPLPHLPALECVCLGGEGMAGALVRRWAPVVPLYATHPEPEPEP